VATRHRGILTDDRVVVPVENEYKRHEELFSYPPLAWNCGTVGLCSRSKMGAIYHLVSGECPQRRAPHLPGVCWHMEPSDSGSCHAGMFVHSVVLSRASMDFHARIDSQTNLCCPGRNLSYCSLDELSCECAGLFLTPEMSEIEGERAKSACAHVIEAPLVASTYTDRGGVMAAGQNFVSSDSRCRPIHLCPIQFQQVTGVVILVHRVRLIQICSMHALIGVSTSHESKWDKRLWRFMSM